MKELFRDGEWRLITWGEPYTEIQHWCDNKTGGMPGWFYAYHKVCGACHLAIPEPILGLKLLYKWDR